MDRHRAADPEAPGVAEGVEHARTLGQPRHPRAVLALVEEPAGLLPTQQIDIPECRGYGMFYGATYGE